MTNQEYIDQANYKEDEQEESKEEEDDNRISRKEQFLPDAEFEMVRAATEIVKVEFDSDCSQI